MIILFNIAIVGLVLLIAYWWSNEGLFSSLLHLVCVIIAGAIAFSLWEPITMSMMSGGWFDNYAWGIVLIGVFAITLLGLRIASDKLIPANLYFPQWVNTAFGGISGAAAGVLTIGICLIGSGFVQSTNEIMSYQGTGRDENARAEIKQIGDPIWLDVAKLTSNFFSTLSVGTLYPDVSKSPLLQYNPRLDELSTLVRDTFEGGMGQLSLAPDAAKVTKVASSPEGMTVVQVTFNVKAKDFGGQLILGSSQIRLIGEADGNKIPDILYPIAWKQEIKEGGELLFKFDDISHYATSVPGRAETGFKFAFDTRRNPDFTPKFIQIRGTRFDLPMDDITVLSTLAVREYRGQPLSDEEIIANRDPLGKDIQHLIEPSSRIRKLRISTNGLPGSIEVNEKMYFLQGTLTTLWRRDGVSSTLSIKGIHADEGTAIVQLDVSQGTNAAFEDLLPIISPDSAVVFIDDDGRKYEPIGFYIDDGKKMQLTLTPSTPIRNISELPMHLLTSSKKKGLTLIFQITEGVRLREFRVGDYTIGTCNVLAERNKR
ncbi:MAG: CvpA family protein [Phycisphaerales bacterium]|nr:CvpA family protein [Planctomycetota bacterium]MBL6997892.1 CvpA family protein [Phycisphaerales bacterium]